MLDHCWFLLSTLLPLKCAVKQIFYRLDIPALYAAFIFTENNSAAEPPSLGQEISLLEILSTHKPEHSEMCIN